MNITIIFQIEVCLIYVMPNICKFCLKFNLQAKSAPVST